MQLNFQLLQYQAEATDAIINCFDSQPYSIGSEIVLPNGVVDKQLFDNEVFGNAPIWDLNQIQRSIQSVQAMNGVNVSDTLIVDDNGKNKNLTSSPLNLDVEMETGTGKTYCYIRSIFELNKRYGWTKFIIVVPSIAIREGVAKSFKVMSEHFHEQYKKKARFFIYDSRSLHNIESFASDGGINVMIVNTQAFNSAGKDNRRIYEVLDEFQSRSPIDVISASKPILILDEPQKMQGEKTLSALSNFKPLFMMRYSATPKRNYNLVYRLDALDAYNQKLVKKITVKGIEVSGLTGTHSYMYLQNIEISQADPVAYIELEISGKNGFSRKVRKIQRGSDLYEISKGSAQYKHGFVVTDIDARDNSVSFTNGDKIHVGEVKGQVDEMIQRTIQIRETIRSHFAKEKQLFGLGIKVLSLFFIDEVGKYRQYSDNGIALDGEYAQIFKDEYNEILALELEDPSNPKSYKDYLRGISADSTHNGYFSIDKKSKRLVDPSIDKKAEESNISNDKDAYDLILKDKERLLSFEEPTRFIFSHSALREGWDNPNVFNICALKKSSNNNSRRQEVGRGLRLCVNKHGQRIDANYFNGAVDEIHKINNLTVITNESYTDFVSALQSEMTNELRNRPKHATVDYFSGKSIKLLDGSIYKINDISATQIYRYLVKNDYIDEQDQITAKYHEAKRTNAFAELPANLTDKASGIFKLINSVFDPLEFKDLIEDANQKCLNKINQANLDRQEFKNLWHKINRKALYQIQIDSNKLVNESISAIERKAVERNQNFVERLTYTLTTSEQNKKIAVSDLEKKQSFSNKQSQTIVADINLKAQIKYDLLGEIAKETNLTRKTVALILQAISPSIFAQFKINPESFIKEVSRVINEQQAKMVVQGLRYNPLQKGFPENEIFVSNIAVPLDSFKATRHVWDLVHTDSTNELKFVSELDGASEVAVYAKLPDRFKIPTPFGDYNPDWAIAFHKDKVKQVYFLAETKGSVLEGELREKENNKIASAHKFFESLSKEQEANGCNEIIKYGVIDNFKTLMQLVK